MNQPEMPAEGAVDPESVEALLGGERDEGEEDGKEVSRKGRVMILIGEFMQRNQGSHVYLRGQRLKYTLGSSPSDFAIGGLIFIDSEFDVNHEMLYMTAFNGERLCMIPMYSSPPQWLFDHKIAKVGWGIMQDLVVYKKCWGEIVPNLTDLQLFWGGSNLHGLEKEDKQRMLRANGGVRLGKDFDDLIEMWQRFRSISRGDGVLRGKQQRLELWQLFWRRDPMTELTEFSQKNKIAVSMIQCGSDVQAVANNDGVITTFVGKGPSMRMARKNAAAKACVVLGVQRAREMALRLANPDVSLVQTLEGLAEGKISREGDWLVYQTEEQSYEICGYGEYAKGRSELWALRKMLLVSSDPEGVGMTTSWFGGNFEDFEV